MHRFKSFHLIILTSLLILGSTSCSRDDHGHTPVMFEVMGTVARVEIHGADHQLELQAVTTVRAAFDSVNTLLSTWDPLSEISRLNLAPADSAVHTSPWLSSCLARAEEVRRLSGGAFDPCAEPLMRLWGFYRRQGSLPTKEELDDAMATMGQYTHDHSSREIIKSDGATRFDLGGIAKGFAVDRAVEEVRALGVTDALVDLGGNLYCLGGARGKSHWRVGVIDPLDREQLFAVVSLRDQAVSTSGSYERFVTIDGRRYGHIMNPATGRPAEGLLSASVISDSAELSDALSTALFVLGPRQSEELLRSGLLTGIEAILVLPAVENSKPRVLATRGLRSKIQLLPQYQELYTLEYLPF